MKILNWFHGKVIWKMDVRCLTWGTIPVLVIGAIFCRYATELNISNTTSTLKRSGKGILRDKICNIKEFEGINLI